MLGQQLRRPAPGGVFVGGEFEVALPDGGFDVPARDLESSQGTPDGAEADAKLEARGDTLLGHGVDVLDDGGKVVVELVDGDDADQLILVQYPSLLLIDGYREGRHVVCEQGVHLRIVEGEGAGEAGVDAEDHV